MKLLNAVFCLLFTFLSVAAQAQVTKDQIGFSLMGSWYNPATRGEGYNFEFVQRDNGKTEVMGYWYTNTKAGVTPKKKLWFTIQGEFASQSMALEIYYNEVGEFLTFNPDPGRRIGTFHINITSCSQMEIAWNVTDSAVSELIIPTGSQFLTRMAPTLKTTAGGARFCTLEGGSGPTGPTGPTPPAIAPSCIRVNAYTYSGFGCININGYVYCGDEVGESCINVNGYAYCGQGCININGYAYCGDSYGSSCININGYAYCGYNCINQNGYAYCNGIQTSAASPKSPSSPSSPTTCTPPPSTTPDGRTCTQIGGHTYLGFGCTQIGGYAYCAQTYGATCVQIGSYAYCGNGCTQIGGYAYCGQNSGDTCVQIGGYAYCGANCTQVGGYAYCGGQPASPASPASPATAASPESCQL